MALGMGMGRTVPLSLLLEEGMSQLPANTPFPLPTSLPAPLPSDSMLSRSASRCSEGFSRPYSVGPPGSVVGFGGAASASASGAGPISDSANAVARGTPRRRRRLAPTPIDPAMAGVVQSTGGGVRFQLLQEDSRQSFGRASVVSSAAPSISRSQAAGAGTGTGSASGESTRPPSAGSPSDSQHQLAVGAVPPAAASSSVASAAAAAILRPVTAPSGASAGAAASLPPPPPISRQTSAEGRRRIQPVLVQLPSGTGVRSASS